MMFGKKRLGVLLLSLFAFALLTILTLTGAARAFNVWAAHGIQMLESPPLTACMKTISNFGAWFVYAPIAVLLLAFPRSRVRVGVPVATVLAVSAVLNRLLKQIFAVPRPDVHRMVSESGFGFPSGHAMNGTAFIGALLILFLRSDARRAHKIRATAGAVVFLLLIGLSRVFLGVHSPTDVLAGYAMGLCLAGVCGMKRK